MMKPKLKYYIPAKIDYDIMNVVKVFLIVYFIITLTVQISSALPVISIVNNTKTNDTSTTKIILNNSESITFWAANTSATENITTWRWYSNGTLQSNNFDNFTISYSSGTYHYITVNVTNPNGTSNTLSWWVNVLPAYDSTQLTLLNETPANDLMDAIKTKELKPFIVASVAPYTNMLDLFFYVFVWGLYFSMMWIKQGTLNIPSVVGVIFGGLLISFLPPAYQLVAEVLITFGIFAVLYIFYKGRG